MSEQRMMSLVEEDYVLTATWRNGDLSPPLHQTEMEVTLTPMSLLCL